MDNDLLMTVLDGAGRILAETGIEVRNSDGSTYKAQVLSDGTQFAEGVSNKVSLTIAPVGLPEVYVEFALPSSQKQSEVTIFVNEDGTATFSSRPFVSLDAESLAPFSGGNSGGGQGDGPEVVCDGSETPEGEVVCFDGYDDNFNGGLNSTDRKSVV